MTSYNSIFVVLLLISGAAHGIARVGNGVVGSMSAFHVEVPADFQTFGENSEGVLSLQSRIPDLDSRSFGSQQLVFKELVVAFPQWKELGFEDLNAELIRRGFQLYSTNANLPSCIKVWGKDKSDGVSVIATWGNGSGFYGFGTPGVRNKQILLPPYLNLKVEDEECRWKP